MDLAYAFLADGVEVLQSGRFFVFNGGVEVIVAPDTPSFIPTLAIAAKLRIQPHERANTHDIRVSGRSPAGTEFFPVVNYHIEPYAGDAPMDRVVYHFISLNLRGIPVLQFGEHTIEILSGEERLGLLTLYIDPSPAGQAPG